MRYALGISFWKKVQLHLCQPTVGYFDKRIQRLKWKYYFKKHYELLNKLSLQISINLIHAIRTSKGISAQIKGGFIDLEKESPGKIKNFKGNIHCHLSQTSLINRDYVLLFKATFLAQTRDRVFLGYTCTICVPKCKQIP